MTFPVVIKYHELQARIYSKTKTYPYYRLAFKSAGRRVQKSFSTYNAAKRAGKQILRDLATGRQAVGLSTKESTAMLAIREAIQTFREETGRTVSPLEAVTGYLEATKRLGKCRLMEAIDGFLATVAVVKRRDLKEVVEEFIEGRRHKTESKNGKRAEMSPVYAANVSSWIRQFAATFPDHAVCDLTKDHLEVYMGAYTGLSAKSRNDRRNAVKMLLRWAAGKDYIPATHRLFDAPCMKVEQVVSEEIDFYRPDELSKMLKSADEQLRVVIALNGLAGLRVEEILRLRWEDVWRVPGHLEVSAAIAKGRRRRLVEMCPALQEWLKPLRKAEGPVWGLSADVYHERMVTLRKSHTIPSRKNGLRHSFVTYHYANHQDENATAAQAGNSPAMLHEHYKGLATKADAEKWFNVRPAGTT